MENVAPSTQKNETGVLPRHKTVDEVAKVAEARLKDLLQDKYMLLNEREDLKTEIRTYEQLKQNWDASENVNSSLRYAKRTNKRSISLRV